MPTDLLVHSPFPRVASHPYVDAHGELPDTGLFSLGPSYRPLDSGGQDATTLLGGNLFPLY
jgi:hypothetical protein